MCLFGSHKITLEEKLEKTAVKTYYLCEMEPLSILLKMAHGTWGPGWPCDNACAHFKISRETQVFIFEEKFWITRGRIFTLEQTTTLLLVCWTVLCNRERCEYSFIIFPCLFSQILLRAHAQEKQDGIPFQVLALLLSCTKPTLPRNHLIQSPSPVIIFLNINTIGEITL